MAKIIKNSFFLFPVTNSSVLDQVQPDLFDYSSFHLSIAKSNAQYFLFFF